MDDEVDEFAPLRDQCDALTSAENVDKSVALGIVRLFHTAETAMLALRFTKDQEIEKLRHELDLTRVTHRNAEMLDSIRADVAKLGDDVRRLSEQSKRR